MQEVDRVSERERLTSERLAELRRIAETATPEQYIATFDPPTILAMLDRIEALEYMVSWYSSRRLSELSRWGGNLR